MSGGDLLRPGETLVQRPGGDLAAVPDEDVALAVDEGARPLSLTETIAAARHAGAEGALGGATAFAAGALRTASGGLSDVAMVKGAGDDADLAAEALQQVRSQHSVASLAGDALGVLAPTPVGKVSGAAGGAAARLVGAGAGGAIRRAVQTGAKYAAQGAIDGAFYGGGQAVSEDILGNPNATAEKLMMAGAKGMFSGAGYGAAAGGTLGGIGSLAASGFERAAARIGSLSSNAELQAYKALGGKTADFKRLGRTVQDGEERARQVGRRALDERIVTPTASKVEMSVQANMLREKVGRELDSLVTGFDKATARFDTAEWRARATELIDKEFGAIPTPDAQAAAKELRDYVVGTADMLGPAPSFRQVSDARRLIDKGKAKFNALNPTITVDGYRAIRGLMEDGFESAAERAAAELGDKSAAEYATKKALYSDVKRIADITQNAAASSVASPIFSLTDTVQGAGGGIAGAAAAAMTGHVGVAAVGGILSNIASAAMNKAVRQHGSQLAAIVLDKASQLQNLQAIANKASARIEHGVRAAVTGEGAKVYARMSHDDAVRLIPHVQTAAANPETVRRFAVAAASGIESAAPKTAIATSMVAARALQHLAETAPKGLSDGPTLQPLIDSRRFSRAEVDAWVGRVLAVEEPESILHAVNDNSLTPEMVDSVRAVYGQEVFRSIQTQVRLAAATQKEPLTWSQQKNMAILLGVPTDATLTSDFIHRMQADIAIADESKSQNKSQSAQGARRPVTRPIEDRMTPGERIAK